MKGLFLLDCKRSILQTFVTLVAHSQGRLSSLSSHRVVLLAIDALFQILCSVLRVSTLSQLQCYLCWHIKAGKRQSQSFDQLGCFLAWKYLGFSIEQALKHFNRQCFKLNLRVVQQLSSMTALLARRNGYVGSQSGWKNCFHQASIVSGFWEWKVSRQAKQHYSPKVSQSSRQKLQHLHLSHIQLTASQYPLRVVNLPSTLW